MLCAQLFTWPASARKFHPLMTSLSHPAPTLLSVVVLFVCFKHSSFPDIIQLLFGSLPTKIQSSKGPLIIHLFTAVPSTWHPACAPSKHLWTEWEMWNRNQNSFFKSDKLVTRDRNLGWQNLTFTSGNNWYTSGVLVSSVVFPKRPYQIFLLHNSLWNSVMLTKNLIMLHSIIVSWRFTMLISILKVLSSPTVNELN